MPHFASFHLNRYYLKSTCLVDSSLQMVNASKPMMGLTPVDMFIQTYVGLSPVDMWI